MTLVIGPTPSDGSLTSFSKILFLATLSVACLPAFLVLYVVRGPSIMNRLWQLARRPPFRNRLDETLSTKLLSLPSVQAYLKMDALEFQVMEGFCSIATQRCIYRSIPEFPLALIPPQTMNGGPTTADGFAACLSRRTNADFALKSTVLHGSDGYDAFCQALLHSNKPDKFRVAVNFHRAALSGFPSPCYLPSSWVLALMSGHFSPVVGYLPEEELVAVFDVNPKYGFILVDSRRLFQAVNTIDVTNGKSRGLVLTEIVNDR